MRKKRQHLLSLLLSGPVSKELSARGLYVVVCLVLGSLGECSDLSTVILTNRRKAQLFRTEKSTSMGIYSRYIKFYSTDVPSQF